MTTILLYKSLVICQRCISGSTFVLKPVIFTALSSKSSSFPEGDSGVKMPRSKLGQSSIFLLTHLRSNLGAILPTTAFAELRKIFLG